MYLKLKSINITRFSKVKLKASSFLNFNLLIKFNSINSNQASSSYSSIKQDLFTSKIDSTTRSKKKKMSL